MKIFKLPDLGEGLPDAIIREWYVKAGDVVKKDQPIVAMETAKALVDVPAPFDAVIEKLFGETNETVLTGNPLIGFEGESDANDTPKDTGTVVGKIEQSDDIISEKTGISGTITSHATIKATPIVRALARKLNVDLSSIHARGERITAEEVQQAAAAQKIASPCHQTTESTGWEPLSGIKRAMALSMQKSHHDIVPVTIIDDADIFAWIGKQDITLRLIRAIVESIKTEPALNALFDGETMRTQRKEKINLGLAVDMPHGLFVPVIKDIANLSNEKIRETIQLFKQQAQTKSIPQADLKDPTIVLSNFGAIAGRYANPIILPPTVAIVGVGRITQSLVLNEKKQPEMHRMIPLSISVDHRAITGGEVARFLRAMIDTLQKPE